MTDYVVSLDKKADMMLSRIMTRTPVNDTHSNREHLIGDLVHAEHERLFGDEAHNALLDCESDK